MSLSMLFDFTFNLGGGEEEILTNLTFKGVEGLRSMGRVDNFKVAIFTLTKDRLEYTKRMLKSLREKTSVPFDHFIVDNGSTDGTREFLKGIECERVKVVLNDVNKGISIASNQALDMIGDNYDFIVKIDNDCEILTDSWLKPLLDMIEFCGRKIILSPRVLGLGGDLADGGVPRYRYLSVNGYRLGLTKHLGGICVVSPAEIYSKFRFNEKELLHGNQGVDFSYYVCRKGFLLAYLEDVQVAHMDGTENQIRRYSSYFDFRIKHESKSVYGENSLLTKIKRPIRRARFIKKLNYLGLDDKGILLHIVEKVRREMRELSLQFLKRSDSS